MTFSGQTHLLSEEIVGLALDSHSFFTPTKLSHSGKQIYKSFVINITNQLGLLYLTLIKL